MRENLRVVNDFAAANDELLRAVFQEKSGEILIVLGKGANPNNVFDEGLLNIYFDQRSMFS